MSKQDKDSKKNFLTKLPRFLQRLLPATPVTAMRQPKIGLALSSGGAKGLAHIGVIEVLEENNIPIHAVSGSSMGSYIAALYAHGCTIPHLKQLAAEIGNPQNFKALADPTNPAKGFIKGEKAREHLERTISRKTFDQMEKDLIVVATDLDTFETVTFLDGVVSEAVHASCAIPGIVVPPIVANRRLTDGGIVEPVPVTPLLKNATLDHIIAVDTGRRLTDIEQFDEVNLIQEQTALEPANPSLIQKAFHRINQTVNPAADGNILDTLRRSLKAAQIRLAHHSCELASISLHPGSRSPSVWHEYHRYEEFIEAGRQAALDALPELLKLKEPISNDHSEKISVVGNRVA